MRGTFRRAALLGYAGCFGAVGLILTCVVAWTGWALRDLNFDFPTHAERVPAPAWVRGEFYRADLVRGVVAAPRFGRVVVYQPGQPYEWDFYPAEKSVTVYSAGWPRRALWAWQRNLGERMELNPYVRGPNRGARTLTLPRWLPRWVPRELFYLPRWDGLVVDTVLYALVAAAAWRLRGVAARRLIAWRRVRRGCCPRCGYALGGLGQGSPCPECGAAAARPEAGAVC